MNDVCISFDMWNTLITPNPEYGAARANAIAELLGIPVEIVRIAYSEVHKQADTFQDTLGISIDHYALIYSFIERCGVIADKNLLAQETILYPEICKRVINLLNTTFDAHHPTFGEGVIEMFDELVEHDFKFGIISNTSFVRGRWLYELLRKEMHADFFKHVNFLLWSDETGMAKPSGKMFRTAKFISKRNKMIHVGDNIHTDGSCIHNGYDQFIYTPNPNSTRARVEEFVNEFQK